MIIFEKLTQETAQSIEDSIIKSCEGLKEDIYNIYNLAKDQPYQVIDEAIIRDFLDHYKREIPLLESIQLLLESTRICSCEVERLILTQMIDYLKNRIGDIKFIRNMFNEEVCFTDVQYAIEDFFNSIYLNILQKKRLPLD